jgi:penicillin-binding protein 2
MRYRTLSLLAIFVGLLTACVGVGDGTSSAGIEAPILQGPKSPDQVVVEFLDNWKTENYQAMYAALSSVSQGAYSLPVFQQRYEAAMTEIGASGITYTVTDTRLQGTSAAITYDVQFNSPVFGQIGDKGRIMRLIQEPKGWGIAWSSMDIVNGLTSGSRVELIKRRGSRADILDRNGQVLVEQDGTIIALYSAEQFMPDVDACLDLLARVLKRPRYELQRNFDRFNADTIFYLGEIDSELDASEGANLDATCGIQSRFERQTRRYVGYGGAVHVTGYIGFIPQDQVTAYQERGYEPGDLVGLAGIEKAYEDALAGQPEQFLQIISPSNVVLRELAGKAGVDPQPVSLTLDRGLQMAAAQAMADAYTYAGGNWGAPEHSTGAGLVALDVRSGAVLAMVSFPFFDPGIFNQDTPALQQNPTLIGDLQTDPRQPFSNRVTQEQYFPGSTFKIITTAAAGSEAVMTEPTFDCQLEWDGRQKYGDSASPRTDWRTFELPESPVSQPAGELEMWQALTASCNPFFYEMGARLYTRRSETILMDYARRMGLGSPTGIGIFQEAAGSLPNPSSIEMAINQAIGQEVTVSILQMARLVAAVANGGTLYKPYIVQQVGGVDGGRPAFEAQPIPTGDMGFSDDVLQTIRRGMCGVTTIENLGTAWFVFNDQDGFPASYTVCGKTGTAQSGRQEPLGWFVAYAPAENPQVAIAAMVEYSREGSETAAPIVRRVLDYYFQQEPAPYPAWWNEIEYIPIKEGQTG